MVESLIHEIFYCCCNKLPHSGYKIRIYYLTGPGGKTSDIVSLGLNQGLIRVMFLSKGSVGETISLFPLLSRNREVYFSSWALSSIFKANNITSFPQGSAKAFLFLAAHVIWLDLPWNPGLSPHLNVRNFNHICKVPSCHGKQHILGFWGVGCGHLWVGVNILLIPAWYQNDVP